METIDDAKTFSSKDRGAVTAGYGFPAAVRRPVTGLRQQALQTTQTLPAFVHAGRGQAGITRASRYGWIVSADLDYCSGYNVHALSGCATSLNQPNTFMLFGFGRRCRYQAGLFASGKLNLRRAVHRFA